MIYLVKIVGKYFNRVDCEYVADKAVVIGQA